MSIAFGGIVAFLFRGLNLVIALTTVVLTSHQLSPDEYGTFVLGLTVVGIVTAMTGGITAATAYQISNQRRAPGDALGSSGAFGGVIGVLAVVAGVAGTALLSGEASSVSLAVGASAAAVIINSVLAGVFLGRDSMLKYNLALVLPPLFALVVIALSFVAMDHRSPEAAMGAYAAGQWGAFIILAVLVRSETAGALAVNASLVRTAIRFAVLAGISSGISYLNYRADLFVVRHFEGTDGVATYSLAVYLAESVWQVSGSLALATYPRVGALPRHEAAELTTRVMRHTVVLLSFICLALFAVSGIVASVLFDKYDGMAGALRFLLPGVLLYGLAQSYSGFYTYQRGQPWVAAIVAGTGLAIDIGLAFVLVPRMGVNGAALASSIAYGTAILAALAVFLKIEGIGPGRILRFGRADIDDYRVLIGRLRAAAGR
ncbi:MAG TPA: polysaccharide biosynthesis C-terminal domain-containing protein [Tepidiformaceae bacterium]|nr:polysaccharide biosynthesis C-terminal domain-containing protein [Tepidiformaceae bacterium]